MPDQLAAAAWAVPLYAALAVALAVVLAGMRRA